MYDYDRRATRTGAAEADLFDLALVVHAVLFALRAPLRHPWIASLSFASILLASGAGIVLFPKRYEVSTTILAGSPLSGALGGERENERDVPTRAAREILLRRDNLLALAQEVRLPERYLAARPPLIRAVHEVMDTIKGKKERTAESITESLVETLEDRLRVDVDGHADTVSIAFQWWDTEIAFDVVNAAAQSFLEMRHAAEIKTVSESIAILEEHRAGLEKQIDERLVALEAREKAESRERRAAPAVVAPRVIAREDPELTRLQTRLAASRRAVADLEAARQQRIVELQSERLRQQSIYASDHPAIAATKRMLEVLQRPSAQMSELGAEVRELEAAVAARGAGAATRSVGSASHASSPDPLSLLLELDPREEYERGQVRHLRTQLEEINNRIASARLRMETAAAAFKHRYSIVTPPRIPKGPIKPYAVLFGASGFLGGLFVSIIASVAADLRRGRVLERWQVERHFGLLVLGEAHRQR